ncbi:MAG: transglutaminase family protein [Syntrophobacterales bacterium]|nr:transglutaminase family protein [Syntrophobacterales bacterium]
MPILFFKKHPHGFLAVTFSLIFLALLVFRLDLFGDGAVNPTSDTPDTGTFVSRDAWMDILQRDRKVGYVHRQLDMTDMGYRFRESILMRVNTMGLVQEVRVLTEGDLDPDLTLSAFRMELLSGLFQYRVRGTVNGRLLTLHVGTPPREEKVEITLQDKLYSPASIHEAVVRENLGVGSRKTFQVFDPLTLTHRPFLVGVLGEEKMTVLGREEKVRKVSLDFMGTRQYAWLAEDGSVAKEEGFLGITLVRVGKEEALSGYASAMTEDLTEAASVASDVLIEKAPALKRLKVRVEGVEGLKAFLDGGRQTLKGRVLTVEKESTDGRPPTAGDRAPSGEDVKKYLEDEPLIQSRDPVIRAQAREIVRPGDSARVRAEKLVSWVYRNIRKRPVLSVPNAVETLKNLQGDCNEHAVLLAALARAAGIPADVEAGLVYQNGRFYYHAWNTLFLGRWVTADATLGQLPADVTHIRLTRGLDSQADLIGVVGKIRLKILEQE